MNIISHFNNVFSSTFFHVLKVFFENFHVFLCAFWEELRKCMCVLSGILNRTRQHCWGGRGMWISGPGFYHVRVGENWSGFCLILSKIGHFRGYFKLDIQKITKTLMKKADLFSPIRTCFRPDLIFTFPYVRNICQKITQQHQYFFHYF